MFRITTINFALEGKGVVNSSIDSDETLLDSDIVVISPSGISEAIEYSLVLHSSSQISYNSFKRYSNRMAVLRKEMETLLFHGKIIICFLTPTKTYSSYSPLKKRIHLSNYAFLPHKSDITGDIQTGKGTSEGTLKLGKQQTVFDNLFHSFKKDFKYEAYIDRNWRTEKYEEEDFILNRSEKPVGAIVRESEGVVVFLPCLKNKKDSQLVSAICQSAKSFFSKEEFTQAPEWVNLFVLPGEEDLLKGLKTVRENIQSLLEEEKEVQKRIDIIISFKRLLYEKGEKLEQVVKEAFELFGFEVTKRDTGTEEHDILFRSAEGKGIAEVEGKDNSWINVGKMDQLSRAVDEDFDITDKYARGVLVGNHFRLTKPEDRKEAFTPKARTVAERKRYALLNTVQLFYVVKYVLENPDDQNFKTEVRKALLSTEGKEIDLAEIISEVS